MYTVTLILPTDMSVLEEKFAEVMADIVAKRLTHEELGILIEKLEEQERNKQYEGGSLNGNKF